jgi:hypothetical protein
VILMDMAMSRISSSVNSLRSVFRGNQRRVRPLAFSALPVCQLV